MPDQPIRCVYLPYVILTIFHNCTQLHNKRSYVNQSMRANVIKNNTSANYCMYANQIHVLYCTTSRNSEIIWNSEYSQKMPKIELDNNAVAKLNSSMTYWRFARNLRYSFSSKIQSFFSQSRSKKNVCYS